MTDTAYLKISTVDLAARHTQEGRVVIYHDKPEQTRTIFGTEDGFLVQTDLDTYVIPRADRFSLMWKVLA